MAHQRHRASIVMKCCNTFELTSSSELNEYRTFRPLHDSAATGVCSLCFHRFCRSREIRHDSIEELFSHLVSIATARNLSTWEEDGANMTLSGRGDPIPDLNSVIAKEDQDLFYELVVNAVEVGLVDMYGASTEQPRRFAEQCVLILNRAEVEPPLPDIIQNYEKGSDAWGVAIEESELKELLANYGLRID